jgi:fatty-acyl-CoA synthase
MPIQSLLTTYRTIRHGLPLSRLKPGGDRTVADLIEEQAAARGDHPFVRFEHREVSYRDYNAAANRVAHWAIEEGLRPGDVVALLMQNRPEYLETWAGLAKRGVTAALLNTNLTGRPLAHAIEAAGTRRLIVGSECLPGLLSLEPGALAQLHVWVWRDLGDAAEAQLPGKAQDFDAILARQPAENPGRDARAGARTGEPALYIYTSGTTGLPKAAKMSHLRLFTTGVAARIAGFGARDTMYCALPLYHSAGGAMAVTTALSAGGTLALRRKFSASQFWDDVRLMEGTSFQYIGEFCRYLLHQPPRDDDSDHGIRFAIGNGLRPDIWEEFQKRFGIPRIVEFYGATEGNVAMVNYDNRVGSVGKRPPRIVPAPRLIRYDVESDTHLRSEQGLCVECAPGETGELIGEIPAGADDARGRFEGYTSKEATERKILRDVFKKGDQWFRTGDLLRCDPDGYYYFIDRIGDTFRWKGENVSTQEVAEALGQTPGVQMVNVYGVKLPGHDGRAGMAAIVMPDPKRFDGKALYELVAQSLPAYAAPVFVRLQPEADVTGTFKLRKVELQNEGYDPAKVGDPLFVRDDQARAYLPLTPERLAAVRSGELRV